MELYREKLNNYNQENERLKIATQAFKKAKENLEEYVRKRIILRDYTIANTKMPNGCELYYPKLNLIEEEQMEAEEFEYDARTFFERESELEITRKYIIKHKELKIRVIETAKKRNLQYERNGVAVKIKKQILVMDYLIEYKVQIEDISFEFKRNFMGNIIKGILKEALNDKYICYNDFVKTSSIKRLNKELTSRYCRNYLVDKNSDWRKNLKTCINANKIECDIKKIQEDIQGCLNANKFYMKERYYINDESSLIIELTEKNHDNECIFYEDDQVIVEIPYPIKSLEIDIFKTQKNYNKDSKEEIKWIDGGLRIRLGDKVDLTKPMYILDLIK